MLSAKIISWITSAFFLLGSLVDPEAQISEEHPPSLVELVYTTPLLFSDTYQYTPSFIQKVLLNQERVHASSCSLSH